MGSVRDDGLWVGVRGVTSFTATIHRAIDTIGLRRVSDLFADSPLHVSPVSERLHNIGKLPNLRLDVIQHYGGQCRGPKIVYSFLVFP